MNSCEGDNAETPMTIGLATPSWPGQHSANGISTAVRHLAIGLLNLGHRPIILAFSIDGPAMETIPVVQISRRKWNLHHKISHKLGHPNISGKLREESFAEAVEEAHRLYQLDAVIVEETQGWAVAAIRRGTVPITIFLHGPWILHKEFQSSGDKASDARREVREAKAMHSAATLIAPSRNVLSAVEGSLELGDMPRTVIPNSIEASGAFTDFTEKDNILFVGRFDYHKGGDTVIEAFRRLHDRIPEARMTFVGPDRGIRRVDGTTISLEQCLAHLKNETREAITVTGKLSADHIRALRQTHPIAIIASRYENLNYTLLEAMAAGQAIVSTRIGGPAETLEEGRTAVLVPSNDPTAMSEALEKLIKKPDFASNLGKAAYAEIQTKFSPETVARKLVSFLRSARSGTYPTRI